MILVGLHEYPDHSWIKGCLRIVHLFHILCSEMTVNTNEFQFLANLFVVVLIFSDWTDFMESGWSCLVCINVLIILGVRVTFLLLYICFHFLCSEIIVNMNSNYWRNMILIVLLFFLIGLTLWNRDDSAKFAWMSWSFLKWGMLAGLTFVFIFCAHRWQWIWMNSNYWRNLFLVVLSFTDCTYFMESGWFHKVSTISKT